MDKYFSKLLDEGQSQVKQMFFRPEVLDKYLDNPKYDVIHHQTVSHLYSVNENEDTESEYSIDLDYHIVTDSKGKSVVVVILWDLSTASTKEQAHWYSCLLDEIPDLTNSGEYQDYVKESFMALIVDETDPILLFFKALENFNEVSSMVCQNNVFRTTYNQAITYPVKNNARSLLAEFSELHKLISSSNLEKEALLLLVEKCIPSGGNLDYYVTELNGNPKSALSLFKTLMFLLDENLGNSYSMIFNEVNSYRQESNHSTSITGSIAQDSIRFFKDKLIELNRCLNEATILMKALPTV